MATLTDPQVRELRTRRVINGEYLTDLAAEFGITVGHAHRIVTGEYRAKAGGPLQEGRVHKPPRRDRSGSANPNARLTEEDRDLIRKLVADGATHQAVADVMFVTRSCVSKVVSSGGR